MYSNHYKHESGSWKRRRRKLCFKRSGSKHFFKPIYSNKILKNPTLSVETTPSKSEDVIDITLPRQSRDISNVKVNGKQRI